MGTSVHRGLKIRQGGASQAQTKSMLRNADADGDGKVSKQEIADLAKAGRDRGFADGASLELFRAGIDAAALTETKSAQPGQQLSTEYIDEKMKPFLERSYGKAGAEAADIIAPQASSELTAGAAKRFAQRSGYSKLETAEIRRTIGAGNHLYDANGNGKVDAKDRKLMPDGNGGYRWAPLGGAQAKTINGAVQRKKDDVNGALGLREAGKMFDGKPAFPGDGGPWTQKAQMAGWLGKKTHAEGGAWKLEKIGRGGGKGYNEFKLDTSRMNPTEALDKMLSNPKDNTMDCAMAKQVAQYQRVRKALGDEKFNKLATKHGMTIGHSDAAYRSGFLAKLTAPVPGASGTKVPDYKAGWQGYAKVSVKDKAVMKRLDAAGWSGEHFTVATNDKGEKVVMAHPFGTMPAKDFDRELKKKIIATAGGGLTPGDIHIEYRPPIDVDLQYARQLAKD